MWHCDSSRWNRFKLNVWVLRSACLRVSVINGTSFPCGLAMLQLARLTKAPQTYARYKYNLSLQHKTYRHGPNLLYKKMWPFPRRYLCLYNDAHCDSHLSFFVVLS